MDILEKILRVKRLEVERLRPRAEDLHRQALAQKEFRGFRAALKRRDNQIAVVAEVKKASPSAGVIAENFDPVAIARRYVEIGAEAISVLTDETFFKGSLQDLITVRNAVPLPILRKDFMVDEVQLAESAAIGASAVLLIVAALNDDELLRFTQRCAEYNLDALLEVHSLTDMDRALDVGPHIIGINNRDLTTFEVDLSITEKMSDMVPADVMLISESGFKTVEDVRRASRCGVDAVLIGEALMRGEIAIPDFREIM